MITNFLTAQGVGSTSTESHQRTSPTKRSGDSFEAVLEKAAEKAEAKAQDLTKIDPKTDLADAEIVAEAEVDAADPEASAEGGTLEAEVGEEDVPAEELIAESELAEKGDEVSQEEGLLYSDVPPQPSEAPKAINETPKAMTATGNGLTADQDSEAVKEQLVIGEKGTTSAPVEASKELATRAERSPAVAQAVPNGTKQLSIAQEKSSAAEYSTTATAVASEGEETSIEEGRVELQAEQRVRSGVSTLLDAHRATLRQQNTDLATKPATTSATLVAQEHLAETSLEARAVKSAAETEPAQGREGTMPVPQAVAPQMAPQPNAKAQVNMASRAAAMTGLSGTTAAQSVATGAVQVSTSSVVASVFGMGEAAHIGDDVLTQRGVDSFALPQMLAEASVRSGASTYRAETPRHVAQQLAEAVATAGKRNVDVSLNPQELGRVNMKLATHDTGVTVVIQAERPETEDLMRRHIQELAREFKEMGFTDINFQFGSGAKGDQTDGGDGKSASRGDRASGGGDAVEESISSLPLGQELNIAADGLDMRI